MRCKSPTLIPANPAMFLAVARGMKLKLRGKKTGFLIRGSDQRGAPREVPRSALSIAKNRAR